MKIYFATHLDTNSGTILTNKKETTRLISFHFLRKQKVTKQEIKRYCSEGKL